jgi:hypothetical protein
VLGDDKLEKRKKKEEEKKRKGGIGSLLLTEGAKISCDVP